MKKETGFTLVEALLSATILAIIGIIMVSLLQQSFQLNSKSQLISKIKQNGQNALNTIDEAVRNADSIECPLPNGTSGPLILVTVKNGTYIRFNIHTESANNGYLGEEMFPSSPGLNKSYCNYSDVPINLVSEAILTDKTDPITGTSLKNIAGDGFSSSTNNSITVKFHLGPSVQAPNKFDSQTSNILFQTTLTVRQR